MKEKGFTLIELLIVVAIIGVLAAVGIPAYVGQQRNAARTEAYSTLQNLRLLEEQFFAEKGSYTTSLGTAGKDHLGNVAVIQAGGSPADPNNALRGFKPGGGLNFSYWVVSGQSITNYATNPPTVANVAAGAPPCFVAFAQGNTGARVANETFAIDCNNNRNF
jgi:prepilin-type N-terminal cleavage/methylation domain-containing protein